MKNRRKHKNKKHATVGGCMARHRSQEHQFFIVNPGCASLEAIKASLHYVQVHNPGLVVEGVKATCLRVSGLGRHVRLPAVVMRALAALGCEVVDCEPTY